MLFMSQAEDIRGILKFQQKSADTINFYVVSQNTSSNKNLIKLNKI